LNCGWYTKRFDGTIELSAGHGIIQDAFVRFDPNCLNIKLIFDFAQSQLYLNSTDRVLLENLLRSIHVSLGEHPDNRNFAALSIRVNTRG
jgi:hypothetical protein